MPPPPSGRPQAVRQHPGGRCRCRRGRRGQSPGHPGGRAGADACPPSPAQPPPGRQHSAKDRPRWRRRAAPAGPPGYRRRPAPPASRRRGAPGPARSPPCRRRGRRAAAPAGGSAVARRRPAPPAEGPPPASPARLPATQAPAGRPPPRIPRRRQPPAGSAAARRERRRAAPFPGAGGSPSGRSAGTRCQGTPPSCPAPPLKLPETIISPPGRKDRRKRGTGKKASGSETSLSRRLPKNREGRLWASLPVHRLSASCGQKRAPARIRAGAGSQIT